MKSKYIATFFLCLICYGQLFAMGREEKEIESFMEMLKTHPDFVSIETYRSNKDVFSGSNDSFISINLTNNRKISFQHIEKNGGGKYANIDSIGDYHFLGYAKDANKEFSSGAYFIDLSYIFNKEIITIVDAIDNYDLLYIYAKKLAKEELKLGTTKMELLHYSWDSCIFNSFLGYNKTSNTRVSKIFVTSWLGPWTQDWEKYLPEDFWEDE